MTVSQDWEAGLRRMPIYHLVQFATLTRHFVSEAQRRWATGKPVPARCARQWIDDLDAQATTAERLIAIRIDTLRPPT
jgi:hypothetical protein